VQTAALARRAVKTAATGLDWLRPTGRGIVVLIYHRVGAGTGGEIDLPAEVFDEQLAYLRTQGPIVSLDEALRALVGAPPPGPDPIVVTFDDGTADFVDHALPVLERHQVPVTLYAATGFIDEGRPFPDGGRPVSWGALRDACSTGLVTVGSHTHNHVLLDRLREAEVAAELDRSIELIGGELGTAPRHFAYPKAVAPSPFAARAVAARFASAALAGTHPNAYWTTDGQRLARTPIQVSDSGSYRGESWFERKVAGGLRAEDRLRQLLNRGRYAGAAT
jgi:peptidoglycan/xylan/chitin deacetylase (PgdA/CDA1 family)